jgi:hypothetical protein
LNQIGGFIYRYLEVKLFRFESDWRIYFYSYWEAVRSDLGEAPQRLTFTAERALTQQTTIPILEVIVKGHFQKNKGVIFYYKAFDAGRHLSFPWRRYIESHFWPKDNKLRLDFTFLVKILLSLSSTDALKIAG